MPTPPVRGGRDAYCPPLGGGRHEFVVRQSGSGACPPEFHILRWAQIRVTSQRLPFAGPVQVLERLQWWSEGGGRDEEPIGMAVTEGRKHALQALGSASVEISFRQSL